MAGRKEEKEMELEIKMEIDSQQLDKRYTELARKKEEG